MDIQEQVIALVHGDIEKASDATEVLRSIVASPDYVDLLLSHIALSRSMSNLRQRITSPTNKTREFLREQISQVELSHSQSSTRRLKQFFSSHNNIFFYALLAIFSFWSGMVFQRGSVDIDHPFVAAPSLLSDSALTNEEILVDPEPHASRSLLRNNNDGRDLHSPSPETSKLPASAKTQTGTPITSLRIVSPKGGERYQRGSILPIRWRGTTGRLSVQVSSDSGHFWRIIGGDVQGDRLDWEIPEESLPSSHMLIRIRPYTTDKSELVAQRMLPLLSEGFSLDLSPDGKWLVTGGRSHEVILWDMATGRRLRTMLGHHASIQSVRFSQDGSRVVSSALDSSAIIWHVATGRAEHILKAPIEQNLESTSSERIWWADFSPDGNLVATGHDEGSIVIWNARTGTKLSRIYAHTEAIRFLKFTQDGMSILASSSDGTGSLTSLEVGAEPQRFTHRVESEILEELRTATTRVERIEASRRKVVNSTILTPDRSVALTCGYDGTVKFWNTETGTLIRSRTYLDGSEVTMLSISQDGSFVMATGSNGMGILLDPFSGEVLKRLAVNEGEQMVQMIHSAFFPNGSKLVVSHTDGRVSLWEICLEEAVSDEEWEIE